MQSGILLNTSNTELRTVNNAIIQLGDIDDTGKGRHFRSRFIKDGLVKIEGHGIVLIQKQTIDQSLPSMIGAPVIIKHQDVTEDNADELRCGAISEAYFNDIDGWYYCEGVIWDKKAQDLINKGWSVSCSYDFLSYNNDGGVENNIKYDKEFTSLNFTHLAIVNNPRYERANIVFNCKVENDKWITIKPHGDDSDDYRRLKLEDGETPKEAIERTYGKGEKSDTKDGSKDISKEEHAKIKEQVSKMSDNELVKAHFESQKGYESETPRAGSMTKHEATYGEVAQELKRRTGRSFSTASTESEIKEALLKAKSDSTAEKEHEDIKEMLKKVRPDLHFNYNKNSKYPYEIKYREGKRFNLNDIATSSDKKEDIYEYLRQQTKQGSDIEKELTAKIKETKENKNTEPKKYNYTLTKREVEGNKMLGGMADTGNYYTNGEFAIDKKYLNIKGQEPTKKEEIEKSLKNILKGDSTYRYTPVKDFEIGELKREYGKPIKVAKYSYYDEKNGYERNIYLNKKYNDLFKNFDLKFGGETEPVFAYKGKDIVGVVMPINAREQSYSKTVNNEIEEELTEDKNQLKLKIDNSKEQDMALLEEIKKLITRVENNKENEMEIENEKVDKRSLIDEVAGIMKSAGCDDEDIRTAIGKMEKIGYDKSEAGTADNKKVKNEDKKEKDDKEIDNEDAEDKEKVEEVEEDVKEDVDNKCKNSLPDTTSFDKINEIYNSVKQIEKETEFVSRQEKLDNAVEYFK